MLLKGEITKKIITKIISFAIIISLFSVCGKANVKKEKTGQAELLPTWLGFLSLIGGVFVKKKKQ